MAKSAQRDEGSKKQPRRVAELEVPRTLACGEGGGVAVGLLLLLLLLLLPLLQLLPPGARCHKQNSAAALSPSCLDIEESIGHVDTGLVALRA